MPKKIIRIIIHRKKSRYDENKELGAEYRTDCSIAGETFTHFKKRKARDLFQLIRSKECEDVIIMLKLDAQNINSSSVQNKIIMPIKKKKGRNVHDIKNRKPKMKITTKQKVGNTIPNYGNKSLG